jgi:hypothetical protein
LPLIPSITFHRPEARFVSGLFIFGLGRRRLSPFHKRLLRCRDEATTAGPVLSFTFVFEGTGRTVSDLLTLHEAKEIDCLSPRFHEELSEVEQNWMLFREVLLH